MEKRFVVQPFDGLDFDNRYEDTFKSAITKSGWELCRTDRDPGVRISIEDIEKGIANSAICFAYITLNNPKCLVRVSLCLRLPKRYYNGVSTGSPISGLTNLHAG